MIFNRLTGLDIGPAPDHIIASNIFRADAPVRYPFLCNAARQDQTQWPGFADNGNSVSGLGRNVGEVASVFSTFHPKQDAGWLFGTNFEGLELLERLIRKIEPPQWPWTINQQLAVQGRTDCTELDSGNSRCGHEFGTALTAGQKKVLLEYLKTL